MWDTDNGRASAPWYCVQTPHAHLKTHRPRTPIAAGCLVKATEETFGIMHLLWCIHIHSTWYLWP